MGSEKDEAFIKQFELNQKRFKEQSALYNDIGTGLSNILKEFVKYGKEVEQDTKRNLQNYFNGVQNKISELNDPAEICRFLIKEKGKYKAKVIEANINKEGYVAKDYEAAIDQIIDPLLKHYESELELEKKLPSSKEYVPNVIVYKPNSEKQKILENKSSIETNKIVSTPLVEKVIPKITKPEIKLQSNFEQIICDGTEQEIMDDFMLLAKTKNRLNGEVFMKEEDVIVFVKKNFSIYKTKPTGGYFEINLHFEQMTILKHFIYQFIVKYNRKFKINKVKYALLLINNFDLFKNNNSKHLASNISESKKPKSPLDLIVIPKRKLP